MKNLIVILTLIFVTGCSTMEGTQVTNEMKFCWERGLDFTWIQDFDAGCVDHMSNQPPVRIAKIKWLETVSAAPTLSMIPVISKDDLI